MSQVQNISSHSITTLSGITHVYFIGIGGIGMSALARYFNSKEIRVSGYDRNRTELTSALENEGILIHYQEDLTMIPKDAGIVVYTPAIPKDHAELTYYNQHFYPVLKRSDVLELISKDSFNICISGTHGKTTITTLTGLILRNTGYGCTAFLGGISVNYNTNFWSSDSNVCVIEADEYDRSFLKLEPNIAVITSMDADHLDIYGTENNMQDAFIAFGNKMKTGGLLIYKKGLSRINEIQVRKKISYSLEDKSSDAYATNIRIKDGGYLFDVYINDKIYNDINLNIGGLHNIENAVAAICIASELQIDENKLKKAISEFKGVKRRFEYIIPPEKNNSNNYNKPVLVDDYAHHPQELRALLHSIRSLFELRKLVVIFQPHLYSRTRDLADGFADSLSIADHIILLPIYPAREVPIDGVSSQIILDKISKEDKLLIVKEELQDVVKDILKGKNENEFVFVMAGAGDIDLLVQPVKEILEKN